MISVTLGVNVGLAVMLLMSVFRPAVTIQEATVIMAVLVPILLPLVRVFLVLSTPLPPSNFVMFFLRPPARESLGAWSC